MFHLMIGVTAIALFAVILSFLLFGIFSVVAGVVGGASAALLFKNKTIKYLILIGVCILLFIGALILIPIIGLLSSAPAGFSYIAGIAIPALIGLLSVAGMRVANSITNNIGRMALIISFGMICVVAVSFAVIIPLINYFL